MKQLQNTNIAQIFQCSVRMIVIWNYWNKLNHPVKLGKPSFMTYMTEDLFLWLVPVI